MSKRISSEIRNIFEENELNDLKRFIQSRQRLNRYTIILRYSFHIIQYAAIFTTTIAIGYGGNSNCGNNDVMKKLVWVGIGLNVAATLVNAFEHVNNSVSKKMLNDIRNIKVGDYVDESNMVDSYHRGAKTPELHA